MAAAAPVPVPAALAALVHEDARCAGALKVTEDGCVECAYTGHRMPPREDAVLAHVQGKRFRRARLAALEVEALEEKHKPLMVRSKRDASMLFCAVTGRLVPGKEKAVERHRDGWRFLKCLEKHYLGNPLQTEPTAEEAAEAQAMADAAKAAHAQRVAAVKTERSEAAEKRRQARADKAEADAMDVDADGAGKDDDEEELDSDSEVAEWLSSKLEGDDTAEASSAKQKHKAKAKAKAKAKSTDKAKHAGAGKRERASERPIRTAEETPRKKNKRRQNA